MSIENVVNFVRQRLYEHGDVQRASIEVVSKAEACGACDNTSVVIVCLNQVELRDESGGRAEHREDSAHEDAKATFAALTGRHIDSSGGIETR
jgi:serine/threonine protein phosphatase PrpC